MKPYAPTSTVSFEALREKLRAGGADFWRSLEDLADTPGFREFVEAEFPSEAPRLLDDADRRHFLKLMGASIALAGAAGCTRQPEEKLYPYAEQPEQIVAGKPMFYATAMPLAGVARGLVVESHMGRPTKIEGNRLHPGSLGATDAYAQAAILSLYDPDRSSTVLNAGAIRPWSAFAEWMKPRLETFQALEGKGLRILTGRTSSPSLAAEMENLLAALPNARWHQYEPVSRDDARIASRLAFGREYDVRYDFSKADVVLVLDADVFSDTPGGLRYARDFARRRDPNAAGGMNRLYVAEPSPSLTGTMADHRLALRGSDVEELAIAIARELGISGRAPVGVADRAEWIAAVARDLEAHRGRSLVVAGESQSVATQLLALSLNDKLGNVGATMEYSRPVEAAPSLDVGSMQDLTDAMDRSEVDTLVILGCNPVYDAPADFDFAKRLAGVRTRIHLGLHVDETAVLSHWHLPEAHFLETWGDARAYDGTASIQQPLIAPLYDGKSVLELVAFLGGGGDKSGYDIVREHWRDRLGELFDERWRRAVHDGVVADTAFPAVVPNWMSTPGSVLPPRRESGDGFEVVFRADASAYDGRFANNGWLQELPRPMTRLTWDNAAWLAPADAEELGVVGGDVVEIALADRSIELPVWIVPGQARGSVTLHLGYGRRRGGYVQDGAGFDVYPLRTSDAMARAAGATLRRTGARYELACTQDHHSMEGRDLVRVATAADVADGKHHENTHHAGSLVDEGHEDPAAAHGGGHADTSLLPPFEYDGYAWGMTIDLNTCTGCNACVVACQSENNIPVVGKDQVAVGREMHWIRVDRYFSGDLDAPGVHHQPVPCMHCEQAPCELVCPVNATVHSDEGLNDMVYNRCVGTRYCSNNCPYKVRRFNFFLYNDVESDIVKMAANPDVTVRSRGVMEKCTYCVQRISRTRIAAKKEGRAIRDGEIVTACQSVCPTEAIRFGDVNDSQSQVSLAKASARNYSLLHELGTKPRTTYLSAVRNPNPELEAVS